MSNSSENSTAGAGREAAPALDFVRETVSHDVAAGRYGGRVHTRFPPEPNGYLHIGHAKAICIDFGVARQFGGKGNLRYDDTNPSKEETEYVDAIRDDVHWLGFDWEDREYYASDYFERFYECAVRLIEKGKAYVCDLTPDDVKLYRGNLTEPGRPSPFRDRPVAESLDLFRRMRAGEFLDGARTLRAKIDMASPNIHMRDPVMYRIMRATHHRTGDAWCIYPMYDYAHPLSDAFEGITHSICTLEFEIHRPLYDWFLENLDFPEPPHQYEFARLALSYTIMSKRKLLELVREGYVSGWDDPRMPTLCGLRRRGYTPEAIRAFCDVIGVTKYNSLTDVSLLEHCLRDDLNRRALRRMAVLSPLRLVVDNYPEGQVEYMDAVNNPEDAAAGARKVPFSRVLYIEQDDFRETAPKKFFRMTPGQEVRLRYGYIVRCTGVDKDAATGAVTAVHCTYDPSTRGGAAPDGRKIKGTIHWVSAAHAVDADVRLYDRLFTVENLSDIPDGVDWKSMLNPHALQTLSGCKLEPALGEAGAGVPVQFERLGYFCADSRDSRPGKPVFNRTVSLKDTWAKIEKAGQADAE